jgi:hypothetical protein
MPDELKVAVIVPCGAQDLAFWKSRPLSAASNMEKPQLQRNDIKAVSLPRNLLGLRHRPYNTGVSIPPNHWLRRRQ